MEDNNEQAGTSESETFDDNADLVAEKQDELASTANDDENGHRVDEPQNDGLTLETEGHQKIEGNEYDSETKSPDQNNEIINKKLSCRQETTTPVRKIANETSSIPDQTESLGVPTAEVDRKSYQTDTSTAKDSDSENEKANSDEKGGSQEMIQNDNDLQPTEEIPTETETNETETNENDALDNTSEKPSEAEPSANASEEPVKNNDKDTDSSLPEENSQETSESKLDNEPNIELETTPSISVEPATRENSEVDEPHFEEPPKNTNEEERSDDDTGDASPSEPSANDDRQQKTINEGSLQDSEEDQPVEDVRQDSESLDPKPPLQVEPTLDASDGDATINYANQIDYPTEDEEEKQPGTTKIESENGDPESTENEVVNDEFQTLENNQSESDEKIEDNKSESASDEKLEDNKSELDEKIEDNKSESELEKLEDNKSELDKKLDENEQTLLHPEIDIEVEPKVDDDPNQLKKADSGTEYDSNNAESKVDSEPEGSYAPNQHSERQDSVSDESDRKGNENTENDQLEVNAATENSEQQNDETNYEPSDESTNETTNEPETENTRVQESLAESQSKQENDSSGENWETKPNPTEESKVSEMPELEPSDVNFGNENENFTDKREDDEEGRKAGEVRTTILEEQREDPSYEEQDFDDEVVATESHVIESAPSIEKDSANDAEPKSIHNDFVQKDDEIADDGNSSIQVALDNDEKPNVGNDHEGDSTKNLSSQVTDETPEDFADDATSNSDVNKQMIEEASGISEPNFAKTDDENDNRATNEEKDVKAAEEMKPENTWQETEASRNFVSQKEIDCSEEEKQHVETESASVISEAPEDAEEQPGNLQEKAPETEKPLEEFEEKQEAKSVEPVESALSFSEHESMVAEKPEEVALENQKEVESEPDKVALSSSLAKESTPSLPTNLETPPAAVLESTHDENVTETPNEAPKDISNEATAEVKSEEDIGKSPDSEKKVEDDQSISGQIDPTAIEKTIEADQDRKDADAEATKQEEKSFDLNLVPDSNESKKVDAEPLEENAEQLSTGQKKKETPEESTDEKVEESKKEDLTDIIDKLSKELDKNKRDQIENSASERAKARHLSAHAKAGDILSHEVASESEQEGEVILRHPVNRGRPMSSTIHRYIKGVSPKPYRRDTITPLPSDAHIEELKRNGSLRPRPMSMGGMRVRPRSEIEKDLHKKRSQYFGLSKQDQIYLLNTSVIYQDFNSDKNKSFLDSMPIDHVESNGYQYSQASVIQPKNETAECQSTITNNNRKSDHTIKGDEETDDVEEIVQNPKELSFVQSVPINFEFSSADETDQPKEPQKTKSSKPEPIDETLPRRKPKATRNSAVNDEKPERQRSRSLADRLRRLITCSSTASST